MPKSKSKVEFFKPEVAALAVYKRVNKLHDVDIEKMADVAGEKNLVNAGNLSAWFAGRYHPEKPSLAAIRDFLFSQGYDHMIDERPEPNPDYDAETLVATPAPEDRQRRLELAAEAPTAEAQINGALEAAVRLLLTQGDIPAPARVYAETVLETI